MFDSVTLSTLTYDPDGYIDLALDVESRGLEDYERRAVVVPTLDGGVALDNMGVFDGARTFDLTVKVESDEEAEQLKTLCRVYPQLNMSHIHGFYRVVPMQYARVISTVTMRFQVLARLA